MIEGMSPEVEAGMDASIFTLEMTAEEYALVTKMLGERKGKTAADLVEKLFTIGFRRMAELEGETILDSDLVFTPERAAHGVK